MRYRLPWAGWLLALVFVLPALAEDDKQEADQKKEADNKPVPAKNKKKETDRKADVQKAAAKDKLVSAGQIVGKLAKVDSSGKNLVVEVTVKKPVPNQGAI